MRKKQMPSEKNGVRKKPEKNAVKKSDSCGKKVPSKNNTQKEVRPIRAKKKVPSKNNKKSHAKKTAI